MDILTNNSDTPELNYAPPRLVSFGWIGEAFFLFGAKPGLWIGATLVAFVLPLLGLLLLDFLLGDPLNMNLSNAAQEVPVVGTVDRLLKTSSGQWALIVGVDLVYLVASAFFTGALFRMAVQQVRGLPVTARDIFRGWRVFGPVTGFALLYLLAILGLELVCFGPLLIALYFGNGAVAAAFVPTAANNPSTNPNGISQGLFLGFGLTALGFLLLLVCSVILVGLLLPGFALVADGGRVWGAFRRSIRAMRGQWLPAAALVFVMGLLFLVSELPLGLGLLVTVPMVFLLPALAYRDMVGMPGLRLPAPPSYDLPQEGVWPPPPRVGQEYGTDAANRSLSPEGVEDKRL